MHARWYAPVLFLVKSLEIVPHQIFLVDQIAVLENLHEMSTD